MFRNFKNRLQTRFIKDKITELFRTVIVSIVPVWITSFICCFSPFFKSLKLPNFLSSKSFIVILWLIAPVLLGVAAGMIKVLRRFNDDYFKLLFLCALIIMFATILPIILINKIYFIPLVCLVIITGLCFLAFVEFSRISSICGILMLVVNIIYALVTIVVIVLGISVQFVNI